MPGDFLSYLTGRGVAKISMFVSTAFSVTALIEAVFSFNVPSIFTDDFQDAALLLRLNYESTLLLIGYGILLFGMLSSTFSMLRDCKFRTNLKKLQIQFIILSSFIISFFIARLFVAILNVDVNPLCQL